MLAKHQCKNQLDLGNSKLGQLPQVRNELGGGQAAWDWDDRQTMIRKRRAATACTRTRWDQERGTETGRPMENAGDARATAMNAAITRMLHKCSALWG